MPSGLSDGVEGNVSCVLPPTASFFFLVCACGLPYFLSSIHIIKRSLYFPVFDLCNRESFESLEKWFHEIRTYTNRPNLVRLLIGNKLDLEQRQVTRDEALRFARLHKLLYAEVSAKTNEGVSNSFYELFEKVYSNTDLWIHDGLTEAGAVRLNSRKSESRKSACSCG
ncbi:hypothetical protein AAHC03_05262 [Spirometra sp. Aus1]